ncbi:MAG: acyl-CoA dehydrogenase, partial [Acidimicrobiia bacterium]|nr:acyl-CoA dehydrogenase [Acidimicrobiia bacterium]
MPSVPSAPNEPEADLSAARHAVDAACDIVDGAARALGSDIDARQVVAYDIAHAAAAMELAHAMLEYGEKGANGDLEARLACAFVADAVHDLAGKVLGREEEWA